EKSVARAFQPVIDQNTILRSPSLVPFISGIDLTKLFITGTPDAEIEVLRLATQLGTVASGRIGSDGNVLLHIRDPIPPQNQILVWDRTNNLVSQLFEISLGGIGGDDSLSTAMIGPDPVTKKLPAAGDVGLHIYGSHENSADLTLSRSDGSKQILKTGIVLK